MKITFKRFICTCAQNRNLLADSNASHSNADSMDGQPHRCKFQIGNQVDNKMFKNSEEADCYY